MPPRIYVDVHALAGWDQGFFRIISTGNKVVVVVVVVVVRLYLTRVTYDSNKTDKLMALKN